ncbi:MAG: MFS transporter [Thermodesulfobacteriota bacterium]
MDETKLYRKTINAWCLYDWANSAFATTVMAAMFPPFYRAVALKAGFSPSTATAVFGYTASAALVIMACLSPVLGAMADFAGRKKAFTLAFAGLGIASTALFSTIGPEAILLASVLYVLGSAGFAGANVFYESLLPSVARPGDLDRVSTRGYALGYVGGGLLLCINLAWVLRPELFHMPSKAFAVKASFVSVALWWALFSIPFLRRVPEPSATRKLPVSALARQGFARVRTTFSHIRSFRELTWFLAAYWLYSDGIGTIIKMSTAYGSEIGIGVDDMVGALVLTQFTGIFFALLFGKLASRFSAKPVLMAGLIVYAFICLGGAFMKTAAHFYALAFSVGTVQGGCQALSRSIFAAMVPRARAAEFFGFFSTFEKAAGILGPLLFGIVAQLTGASRLSILALMVFFLTGAFLLSRVNVEKGIRDAAAAG